MMNIVHIPSVYSKHVFHKIWVQIFFIHLTTSSNVELAKKAASFGEQLATNWMCELVSQFYKFCDSLYI